MIEVILASTQDGGIGYKAKLPWSISSELSLFQAKTRNNVVIVGRSTYETIGELPDRTVLVVGSGEEQYKSIEDAVEYALKNHKGHIMIIGGKKVYDYTFKNLKHIISKIHLTVISEEITDIDCYLDTNPSELMNEYRVVETLRYTRFVHYVLEPKVLCGELQYLHLLKDVLLNGKAEIGRNGKTYRKTFAPISIDLSLEFPLLTTKKMFTRGIIEELLFFMRGETDSKLLESKGVNIWKGNTSRDFLDKTGLLQYPEGMMGPMYGYNWRFFGAEYVSTAGKPSNTTHGIDQLQNIIHLIKTEPQSRRIIMTDFNPAQVHLGVLYPCHSIVLQFFVRDSQFLDMTCYNRSSDLFLGLPFNIASSSLMLMIIAELTGLKAGMFHLVLGDCHIYEEHIEAVKAQLTRVPFKPPTMSLDFNTDDVNSLSVENFHLRDYESHASIKAPMIA